MQTKHECNGNYGSKYCFCENIYKVIQIIHKRETGKIKGKKSKNCMASVKFYVNNCTIVISAAFLMYYFLTFIDPCHNLMICRHENYFPYLVFHCTNPQSQVNRHIQNNVLFDDENYFFYTSMDVPGCAVVTSNLLVYTNNLNRRELSKLLASVFMPVRIILVWNVN